MITSSNRGAEALLSCLPALVGIYCGGSFAVLCASRESEVLWKVQVEPPEGYSAG